MELRSLEITSCNILKVTVGTTGLMGGDTGHGGRTVFRLEDIGGTDMRCFVDSGGRVHRFDEGPEAVTLVFGGDTELETFITALEYAAQTLRSIVDGPEVLHSQTVEHGVDVDNYLSSLRKPKPR